ncbi:MAG: hypothetical protein LBV72_09205 [Tannerella sp.]|jgi:hypothetical protein|nr:hypothetical protein [Tannerella sp.]
MTKVASIKILLLLFASILIGCEKFDNYSTNPNHALTFSVDTISFDTIFSSVGSVTKQFVVYNPNDEALKIESIQLANTGKSGFRINVDGRKGDQFKNIDIWGKDSLYILVEVTVNPSGQNQPLVVEDSIMFYTNGNRQSVLLQAYGQDVHLIKGGVVYDKDITFTADKPYLIYDSIMIAEGATFTVDKGATLYMHNKASLIISGTMKAVGTMDEPIVIRGDRLDSFEAGISVPYDCVPGQWGGIYFAESSFNNEFDYVFVRNGTSGLVYWKSDPEKMKMQISNSQITNMDGNVLMAIDCQIEAVNSEFSNAAGASVALVGGVYHFIHCTINNQQKIGKSRDPLARTLMLSNVIKKEKEETTYHSLKQAYFDNCIIDGSYQADSTRLYQGEISFSPSDENDIKGNNETFNYRFNSCFIKTARVTDNDRFINDLYIYSPTYLKTGGKDNTYAYDFRLKNESVGIGKADRTISEEYPVDRYGVNRLTSEYGPSIGAYEYVYQEEEENKK